jgi:hypothetical protein
MTPENTTTDVAPPQAPAAPPPPVAPPVVVQPAPEHKSRVTLEMLKILADGELRENYIRAIVNAELERDSFDMDQRRARVFAISGKFDDLKGETVEQAIASAMSKIQLGRSWGLSPTDSIRYIYWTNGRPNIENEIVASKMKQAGYNWDADWDETVEQYKNKPWKRCTGCTLWLKKYNPATKQYEPVLDRKGNPVSESFTEADADHAMIWEKGKQIPLSSKWNFQSWPRDMYYWRTIGRLKKYHLPEILRGAITRAEVLDVLPEEPQVEEPTLLAPPVPDAEYREVGEAPADIPSERPGAARRNLRDEVIRQASLIDNPPEES